MAVANLAPATPIPGARLPRILHAEPQQTFLDLGPVVVQTPAKKGTTAFLSAQADYLQADGFILESRRLGEVYGVHSQSLSEWRQKNPKKTAALYVAHWLLTGAVSEAIARTAPAHFTYYRAFRMLREGTPAIKTLPDAPVTIQEVLQNAQSLQEQVRILVCLLEAGDLSPSEFEHWRQALVGS